MLSSFRSCTAVLRQYPTGLTPSACGLMLGSLWLGAASAAEYYVQPIASVSSAYNTNVELARAPAPRNSAVGYFADAQSIIGIATPTSDTTLIPRLLYNFYPTQKDLDRLEAFLSLNGRYTWQRDRLTLSGYFDRRDDLNAETPSADYNPNSPGTTSTTGRINLGTVRDFADFQPNYAHYLTPLSQIGVAGEYQRAHFSPDDAFGHVNYNYYLGRGYYTYTFSPRLETSFSGFGSRYRATNIDSVSTSGGAGGSATYAWTQTWSTTVNAGLQHTHQVQTAPSQFDGTANPWSATLSTAYTGQVDTYRLDAGRTIAPSSAGGLFRTDQIRAQYTHNFTPRLTALAAVRYFRDGVVTGIFGNNSRNYLTSNLSLQYMLTRTIFVQGMYSYVWQKYHVDPTGASTNIAMVTIGYRGLERQR